MKGKKLSSETKTSMFSCETPCFLLLIDRDSILYMFFSLIVTMLRAQHAKTQVATNQIITIHLMQSTAVIIQLEHGW